ncbi:MAG: hypothetical protein Q9M89_07630 [Persephonella sp.]|nr:hypothetical protein [Persephonella sp.]
MYIFDGREEGVKKKALIYLMGVPVFTAALVAIYLLGSFVSFILGLIKEFQLWKYLEEILGIVHLKFLLEIFTNAGMIVQFTGFLIILFILYRYLSPHLIYRTGIIFYVSLFVSGLLFFYFLISSTSTSF